jgi:hypothetical protein
MTWPSPRVRLATLALVVLTGSLVTAGAAVFGNGSLLVTLAPVAAVVVIAIMWAMPTRYSLFAIAFLSLAINGRGDGPWDSPLAPLGTFLGANLNKSTPLPIPLPAAVSVLLLLLAFHVHRLLAGTERNETTRHAAPPIYAGLALSLVAVLSLVAFGWLRHGDVQMAKNQVQTFVVLLLFAYLCAVSLRGPRDHRVMFGIMLASACIKAAMAVYVVQTVTPAVGSPGGKLAFATSHGDSLLFAFATVFLIARFFEQPVRRYAVQALLVLPLLTAGMIANNRRLVWVEIVAAMLLLWVVSRRTVLKRFAANAVLLAMPLIVIYIAIGWEAPPGSKIFAPVQTFKSVDDQKDSSTLYRDLENYNLIATMRENPIVPIGFGQPFMLKVRMDDISFFREFQFMPHNSLLGLWAFTGVLGFSGLWLVMSIAVFLAARSYHYATTAETRMTSYVVMATLLIYAIQCWGDIGFSEGRGIYIVGTALAIAGQVAKSTGAWGVRTRQQA